jgi:hypothetical protein
MAKRFWNHCDAWDILTRSWFLKPWYNLIIPVIGSGKPEFTRSFWYKQPDNIKAIRFDIQIGFGDHFPLFIWLRKKWYTATQVSCCWEN